MTKDWSAHKHTIISLYRSEGKTLEEVRAIMTKEHGFEASIRSYRQYLDKWDIWKYNCRRRQGRHSHEPEDFAPYSLHRERGSAMARRHSARDPERNWSRRGGTGHSLPTTPTQPTHHRPPPYKESISLENSAALLSRRFILYRAAYQSNGDLPAPAEPLADDDEDQIKTFVDSLMPHLRFQRPILDRLKGSRIWTYIGPVFTLLDRFCSFIEQDNPSAKANLAINFIHEYENHIVPYFLTAVASQKPELDEKTTPKAEGNLWLWNVLDREHGSLLRWLLDCLWGLLLYERTHEDDITKVWRILLESVSPVIDLPFERSFRCIFRLSLDPSNFVWSLAHQSEESVKTALAFIGTPEHAQAMPCYNYIMECWPSYGAQVFDAVIAAVASERRFDFTVSNIGTLLVTARPEMIEVHTEGCFEFVSEVAQTLAWVGAALRHSSEDRVVSSSVPIFETVAAVSYKGLHIVPPSIETWTVVEMMSYVDEPVRAAAEGGGGLRGSQDFSWRNMAGNPVLARGFPVRHRWNNERGLEVPLRVMALLVGAETPTLFHNRAVIKGHSAGLVATSRSEDVISWHLVTKENGGRLSFLDLLDVPVDEDKFHGLSLESLAVRHVVD